MSTTDPSRTPAATFRVPGLDGIRALAVTVVIVFHLFPGTLVGGYLGVDVFFVVSGFLITTLLLREHGAAGSISLRGFWARRARRLLPALVLLLLVCGTAALVVGGDVLVGLGGQVLGALTFSSNWLFIAQGSSYFDAGVPELFRNLWSLAVEEQFYVLWPLLLVLVLIRIPRWLRLVGIGLLAIASATGMALLADPVDPTRAYYGTDTHSFGLAIGAFLAVLALGRELSGRARWTLGILAPLAVAALVIAAVFLDGDEPLVYRGGLAAVAVLSAVAIAGLLIPRSPLARVLDLRPIRWVGVRSYGLYLWHWPVFVLLGSAYPTWPREGIPALALGGVALALTVAAAALSYRFVEQPIRRLGFRGATRALLDVAPRTPRAIAASLAMLAVVGLTAGSVAAITADPGRGEAESYIQAGQAAIDAAEQDPAPAATPEPAPSTGPASGDEITAIGDSVMLAAAPTMQAELPGIAIDAVVSRQMSAAPGIIQGQLAAGTLRPVVVLALGTNGPVDPSALEQVRDLLGPKRELVVVSAQAPRGWIPGVNDELSRFALVYRNVELANWHDAAQPILGELARDQIHFGPLGAGVFTGTIEGALQRLAELPPLRDESTTLAVPSAF